MKLSCLYLVFLIPALGACGDLSELVDEGKEEGAEAGSLDTWIQQYLSPSLFHNVYTVQSSNSDSAVVEQRNNEYSSTNKLTRSESYRLVGEDLSLIEFDVTAYDASDRVATEQNFGATGSLQQETKYTRSANGRITEQVTTVYDGSGNETSTREVTYDESERETKTVTKQFDADGEETSETIQTCEYETATFTSTSTCTSKVDGETASVVAYTGTKETVTQFIDDEEVVTRTTEFSDQYDNFIVKVSEKYTDGKKKREFSCELEGNKYTCSDTYYTTDEEKSSTLETSGYIASFSLEKGGLGLTLNWPFDEESQFTSYTDEEAAFTTEVRSRYNDANFVSFESSTSESVDDETTKITDEANYIYDTGDSRPRQIDIMRAVGSGSPTVVKTEFIYEKPTE